MQSDNHSVIATISDTAVTWHISRFLDDSDLKKVFMSGLMPRLISVARDERWWHARCEVHTRRSLGFSSDGDSWRAAYEKDNVLAVRILTLMGRELRSEDAVLAVQGRTPRVLSYLLLMPEFRSRAVQLLHDGVRSGCVAIDPANAILMEVLECKRGIVSDHIAVQQLANSRTAIG